MRSLLIAVAVVLAVLTVAALLIALAAAKAAPLAARLQAWWMGRAEAAVTIGRPGRKVARDDGRDDTAALLAAVPGDDHRAADGGDSAGGDSAGGDGDGGG